MVVNAPTINEILSFILRYRKGNAFTTETRDELFESLQAGIAHNCVLVDYDDFGVISGVIVAAPFNEDKRLHIHAILCIKRCSLGKFAYWLQKEAKRLDWTITATRHGRTVEYKDTQKLLNKLITRFNRK